MNKKKECPFNHREIPPCLSCKEHTHTPPKKEPKDLISPKNQMPFDPEIWKETKDNEPIIRLEENKIMPLFILIHNLTFFHSTNINYMSSILYNYDTKTIITTGRIRFDSTGNKSTFKLKKPEEYTPINYNSMKVKNREITQKLLKDIKLFKEQTPAIELEFKIGESMKSIIKKLNNSNQFNIGIADK